MRLVTVKALLSAERQTPGAREEGLRALQKLAEEILTEGSRLSRLLTEVPGQSTVSAEERARDRKSRELLETAVTARETAWCHPGGTG